MELFLIYYLFAFTWTFGRFKSFCDKKYLDSVFAIAIGGFICGLLGFVYMPYKLGRG